MIKRIIIALLVVFGMANLTCAEDFSRAKSIEVFASSYFMDEELADVEEFYGYDVSNLGIEVGLDNTFMFGMGIGYNINNYFNINLEGTYGSTDGIIKSFGTKEKGDVDLLGMNLNLDYNILKGRLTPLLTIGVGFIDFNIDDSDFDNTFGGTYATVNAGGGFRYDITNHLLVKAVYRFTWIDELDHTDDNLEFDGFHFSVGYRF